MKESGGVRGSSKAFFMSQVEFLTRSLQSGGWKVPSGWKSSPGLGQTAPLRMPPFWGFLLWIKRADSHVLNSVILWGINPSIQAGKGWWSLSHSQTGLQYKLEKQPPLFSHQTVLDVPKPSPSFASVWKILLQPTFPEWHDVINFWYFCWLGPRCITDMSTLISFRASGVKSITFSSVQFTEHKLILKRSLSLFLNCDQDAF